MSRIVLTGKIHTARLTECELDYEGSLEIDADLMKQANILPYEKILVVNRRNGTRLETYAIPGEAGTKVFCLNGPAAHQGAVGDTVTIMAFSVIDDAEAEKVDPKIIVLDKNNDVVQVKGRKPGY